MQAGGHRFDPGTLHFPLRPLRFSLARQASRLRRLALALTDCRGGRARQGRSRRRKTCRLRDVGEQSRGSNSAGVWEQLDSGRVTHRFEPIVLAATLTVIPVLIIETEGTSGVWKDVAFVANWAIWLIFLAELVFIFTVAPRKRAAFGAHWLDELIVIFTAPLFGRLLASLRLVRLARLLRLLRLSAILSRALQRERAMSSEEIFRFVGLVTVFVVVLSGAVEATVDTKDFNSLWDGIWWAVVTVTTVGYGDVTPHSVQGRLVAMVVMLFGIGFLSVLTATIASRFVQTDTDTKEMAASLRRIEAELADLRQQLAGSE